MRSKVRMYLINSLGGGGRREEPEKKDDNFEDEKSGEDQSEVPKLPACLPTLCLPALYLSVRVFSSALGTNPRGVSSSLGTNACVARLSGVFRRLEREARQTCGDV